MTKRKEAKNAVTICPKEKGLKLWQKLSILGGWCLSFMILAFLCLLGGFNRTWGIEWAEWAVIAMYLVGLSILSFAIGIIVIFLTYLFRFLFSRMKKGRNGTSDAGNIPHPPRDNG